MRHNHYSSGLNSVSRTTESRIIGFPFCLNNSLCVTYCIYRVTLLSICLFNLLHHTISHSNLTQSFPENLFTYNTGTRVRLFFGRYTSRLVLCKIQSLDECVFDTPTELVRTHSGTSFKSPFVV